MSTVAITRSVFQGFLIGLSIACPPGPINLEIFRRALAGGFSRGWFVGLGACTGDFLWALLTLTGAAVIANDPRIRLAMGILSAAILLVLGIHLLRGWFRRRNEVQTVDPTRRFTAKGGFFLGFSLSLTSPWNVSFWFAVVGQGIGKATEFSSALLFAGGVLLGAFTWINVLSAGVARGRTIFQAVWRYAELVTGVVMVGFAVKAFVQLRTLAP